ncbi:hypothetical protein NHX12_004255 [Muraenolepis orangiensis]|uniref:Selenoprotein P N-terminal domain-containing protein n=1 Tax=Muraenolepis orangiensis TaxID=630683 RepID=A0A9Q0DXE9_9TELE|nr:hypothetical protein NHX12_004255 [Muraenolepis orangiensis]
MRCLLPLWLGASLPGLLWAATALLVEGDSDPSRICKAAPNWQASKLGHLRDKLRRSNLTEVAMMVVNERQALSRAMYWELKRRVPVGVPVYQQAPLQDDVWDILDGDKDDFLVYDSFLHYPYIEAAVRATYLKNICNCSCLIFSKETLSGGGNHTASGETTLPTTPQGTPRQTEDMDMEYATTSPQGVHQHLYLHQHHHHHPPHHHQLNHMNNTGNMSHSLHYNHPTNHNHRQKK